MTFSTVLRARLSYVRHKTLLILYSELVKSKLAEMRNDVALQM